MAVATLKRPFMDDHLNISGLSLNKRRRLPYKRARAARNGGSSGSMSIDLQQRNQKFILATSPFANIPPMSNDQISLNIYEEMLRFQKRRQLHFDSDDSKSGASSSETNNSTQSHAVGKIDLFGSTPAAKDKPLFTFEQVGKICGRMMTDRENELRETYGKLLIKKLDEQYDTFVKFTQDQLQVKRGYAENPSYLS